MTSPIYTEKTECQDCYKCVRQCPVKAIQVKDGNAVVMQDLCIFCGRCIEVCPVKAKKLRSDVSRAKQLIELNKEVYASLAPSFPAEFNVSSEKLVYALKKLGFKGISETSIGAEIISRKIADNLQSEYKKIISSACPTVMELVKKYYPHLLPYLSDIVSPLHAHADFLKDNYGNNTKVVFIGPCISKKLEADDETSPVDLALTFLELKEWFEEEGIDLNEIEAPEEDCFIPEEYNGAAEFAVEGGMLNTIKKGVSTIDKDFISCSGVQNIMATFNDIEDIAETKKVFLEYLACDGGCISGKGMTCGKSYIKKRLDVIDYYNALKPKAETIPAAIQIEKEIPVYPVSRRYFNDKQILEVLHSLEKYTREDEINCSGCGYNSCRDFAVAVLEGKAERSMCVTHMRNLAIKKSNALMKALPLAVVITDINKNILECNEKFLRCFLDSEIDMDSKIEHNIEGVELGRFISDLRLFDRILISEESMIEGTVHSEKHIFKVFVFKIGKEKMTGAIFQDITSPTVRKETVIKKAEEVIEKSLSSVQQIASLLGENAAETQLILNSLIETFSEVSKEE